MAGTGSPSVMVAGIPSTSSSIDEIKEYEKILKISDDVFAGIHPRLKVPEKFICKAPSRTLQSSIALNETEHAGDQQAKTAPAGPSLIDSRAPQLKTLSPSVASPAGALPSVVPKSTSGIDPILLAKSDDLVRAEIRLQRKRIENLLKEQVERSKLETRQKNTALESRPDLDISNVLDQALEIVKPLPSPPVSGTNDAALPSDSIDENSLYSSRAPDSPLTWDYTPAETERHERGHTAKENIALHSDARRTAEIDSHTLQGTTDQAIPLQDLDQRARAEKDRQRQDEPPLDEPEYSPPEPTVQVAENRGDDEYQPPEVVVVPPAHTATRQVDQNLPSQLSMSPDVRVVRNHITSPAAPQPSRVSPLATAKGPSVQRILQPRSAQNDYSDGVASEFYSTQTSPEGPIPQQLLPRKRRRVRESRSMGGVRPVDTPEPHIKIEAVSPPPFHDTARTHQPAERPVYIDVSSPQYVSPGGRRELISREPIYELDRYGSGGRDFEAEHNVRTASRLSVRRPLRDNQDLRRVASLHNARIPEVVSRDFIEPELRPQSTARLSPYVVVERQPDDYADVPAIYSRRRAHYDDYPPPPRYREVYVEDEAGRRYVEAAPARRIVVDEYGNQYYEMVPAPKVRPAPSIPARVLRPDEYPERAYVRSASVRAASIVEDGYSTRRYIQEMAPPPPGAYRRVAENARNASENQRLYPSRPMVDRDPVFRSGSVAVDYGPRQATYVEEDIPRERLIRTSSVRPPASRYEQHPEGIHRVQSVRPGGREMSAYINDDGHSITREGRYITEEEGARLAMDGSRDVVHHVIPRY